MKLTTLDEDLRIHQKLEDEPNDVGGLSAQALKEKFDQAGVTIQRYLNETHLPEEEKAVADALSEAKEYADARAKATEQGNMKTAVYDAKKRRRDIFDYTDEKIEELQAKKSSGAWICGGECNVYAASSRTTKVTQFSKMTDPYGLWSETEKAFVVPEGGKIAMMLVRAQGSKNTGADAVVRVLVNGTERASGSVGYYTNGTWDFDTFAMPLIVEGGDRITLMADACNSNGSTALSQIAIRNVGVIIFA